MKNTKTILKKKNINLFFPISFILIIIPLIVRMTVVDADKDTINIFGPMTQSDLFSQRKAFFLIIFSIMLVFISILFFKKIFERKDKIFNSILILTILFWFFTLLSTAFSPYKQTSIYGIFDRAEGFITITCYLILFIYCLYTFKDKEDYKYITIPILILVSINALLGIFQYAGSDLILSNLGRLVVLPSEYLNSNSKLNLLYEAGKLYGTLYHYNYVGSFVAIVLPLLLCLTIFETDDIAYKIYFGVGTLFSVWLLFGSTSRAGIIGIAASVIFAIIIFGKLIRKKLKILLICFISITFIAFSLNFIAKGAIFERIPGLITDTLSVFKNTNDFDYKEHTFIKDIKHNDKDVQLILQNETLKISYENDNYVFRNAKDKIINYVKQNDKYITSTKEFKNISINFENFTVKSVRKDVIILNINNTPTFIFNLKDDNSIHLINPNTRKDVELEYPEAFGFRGKEKLGSARGYIWSRSIPMVKDNIILGSGPDTFMYRFPQNDLIGKYYTYDNPNIIVDKPHNLYIQIALNEGVIALIAFLSIMIIYVVDSMKLYILKEKYEKSQILGISTCLGVIGYLFAGIFNDSVVSVAPIFWIVLGVGVALNYINRKTYKH